MSEGRRSSTWQPGHDPAPAPEPQPEAPEPAGLEPAPETLPGDEAADLAGEELQEQARALSIEGRSSMSARELRRAIREAERPKTLAALAVELNTSTKAIERQVRALGLNLSGTLKVGEARAIAAAVRRHEWQGPAADHRHQP